LDKYLSGNDNIQNKAHYVESNTFFLKNVIFICSVDDYQIPTQLRGNDL